MKKSGEDLRNDIDNGKRFKSQNNSKTNVSNNNIRKLSLEDESQFAADFQQQHHRQRWGQGIQYVYIFVTVI